jgi:DNA repair photolyase
MRNNRQPIRGRGAKSNPANRFKPISYIPDPEASVAGASASGVSAPDLPAPGTQFFRDTTRSIITSNESPDVGFDASINPYRGCEHGCIYCYARPYHEYLGFSAGLDFETKILVKENAPALLRRELSRPGWRPKPLSLCGVTDPYQPVERRLRLTARCLEVLSEFRNPVSVLTKNYLVTRDAEPLAALARVRAAVVGLSIITLDEHLARMLEPRTSSPARRLEALTALSRAGIPAGVFVAPVIPGLTDHEIPRIVSAAAQAGARFATYAVIRLPYGVGELLDGWLADHMPDRRKKVMGRIRAIRGGKIYGASFDTRLCGTGVFAEQIAAMFRLACRRAGLDAGWPELSTESFGRPRHGQESLFGQ